MSALIHNNFWLALYSRYHECNIVYYLLTFIVFRTIKNQSVLPIKLYAISNSTSSIQNKQNNMKVNVNTIPGTCQLLLQQLEL